MHNGQCVNGSRVIGEAKEFEYIRQTELKLWCGSPMGLGRKVSLTSIIMQHNYRCIVTHIHTVFIEKIYYSQYEYSGTCL